MNSTLGIHGLERARLPPHVCLGKVEVIQESIGSDIEHVRHIFSMGGCEALE